MSPARKGEEGRWGGGEEGRRGEEGIQETLKLDPYINFAIRVAMEIESIIQQLIDK